MNSDQIERILTQDPYTKQVFKDVCPRDRLPARYLIRAHSF